MRESDSLQPDTRVEPHERDVHDEVQDDYGKADEDDHADDDAEPGQSSVNAESLVAEVFRANGSLEMTKKMT